MCELSDRNKTQEREILDIDLNKAIARMAHQTILKYKMAMWLLFSSDPRIYNIFSIEKERSGTLAIMNTNGE